MIFVEGESPWRVGPSRRVYGNQSDVAFVHPFLLLRLYQFTFFSRSFSLATLSNRLPLLLRQVIAFQAFIFLYYYWVCRRDTFSGWSCRAHPVHDQLFSYDVLFEELMDVCLWSRRTVRKFRTLEVEVVSKYLERYQVI